MRDLSINGNDNIKMHLRKVTRKAVEWKMLLNKTLDCSGIFSDIRIQNYFFQENLKEMILVLDNISGT